MGSNNYINIMIEKKFSNVVLKRIGLALSDPMKIIAKPFKTIQYSNLDDFFKSLTVIIEEKEVECIVLGYPIGMKGQETIQTKNVLEFNEKLKLKIKIPIVFQDERLSSLSAEKSLIEQKIKTGFNKSKIDETAAAIFLQQFLDTKRI